MTLTWREGDVFPLRRDMILSDYVVEDVGRVVLSFDYLGQ